MVVQQVQQIVGHLGTRVSGDEKVSELAWLKANKWLPALGHADRWYAASELYAAYQDYLFQTQALFLDVPTALQQSCRHLFEFLGIHLTPQVNLVVKHLLFCASQHIPVNTAVYRFLNDKAEEPAVGQLRDKKCLWLGGDYRAPSQVFWGEHQFGRYRQRLGQELRGYSDLFERLGVRDIPRWEDALDVLREIADEFGSRDLDDEALAVLMACWRSLDEALDDGEAPAEKIRALRTLRVRSQCGANSQSPRVVVFREQGRPGSEVWWVPR